ncbi:hypothetical protein ACFZ8E_26835 [Methylobacterium sp. HMF5984]|uniref:hypothetical protein n=1 Tax=Methylobacterium sp. HMF5984 TaxID=3367370 RepID=UPI0038551B3F
MNTRERAAYKAGLRAAIHAARTTAITMETAPGSADVRKQAAVAALSAFAESAEGLALTPKPDPTHEDP